VIVPALASAVLDGLLAPVELVISQILVANHAALTAAGLSATAGLTWAASIALLVIVVRLCLVPLVVHQVRSSHRLATAAPALREIRRRYSTARDPEALARLRADTAAVYAEVGARPLGCLPVLVQIPVLVALFRVLNGAARGGAVGAMTATLAAQVDHATLAGVSLADTVHSGGSASIVVSLLTAVTVAALWLAQRRQLMRNTPPAALEGPAGRAQRMSVWLLPLLSSLSGLTFPVGVLLYFACTNTWSLIQQAAIIRWLPTPGSPAHTAMVRRHGA
jgi:YidC/Oxa1 family membrane protein insertase